MLIADLAERSDGVVQKRNEWFQFQRLWFVFVCDDPNDSSCGCWCRQHQSHDCDSRTEQIQDDKFCPNQRRFPPRQYNRRLLPHRPFSLWMMQFLLLWTFVLAVHDTRQVHSSITARKSQQQQQQPHYQQQRRRRRPLKDLTLIASSVFPSSTSSSTTHTSVNPIHDALNPLGGENSSISEGSISRSDVVLAPEEQNKKTARSSSFSLGALVSRLMGSVLQDPARLGSRVAMGCQFGLVVYLGLQIVRIIQEGMSNMDLMMDTTAFESPLWIGQRSQDQVAEVLQWLEQQEIEQIAELGNRKGASNDDRKSTVTMEVPSKMAAQSLTLWMPLALRLRATGMPWRSTNSQSDNVDNNQTNNYDKQTNGQLDEPSSSTSGGVQRPSVESILLQLTRAEAALLQQSLWTPHKNDDRDKLWNSVLGLDAVKDRLARALATMMIPYNAQLPSDASPQADAYVSLFARGQGRESSTLSSSSFGSASTISGALLYGPPGCGKTMLVKALASYARLPCLVVAPSILLRKFVGDTNQQVRTLFTLASKLAPCILCIDELDGLFRERSDNEHEVSRDLKTEFLQWLDGMVVGTTPSSSFSTSPGHHSILVVGATNRPFDVDSALLRRLPQSFYVGLPDEDARNAMFSVLLSGVPSSSDIDVASIAERTNRYSPSDIRQVLQTAALLGPMRQERMSEPNSRLAMLDIEAALRVVPPTPLSQNYQNQLFQFMQRQPTTTSLLSSSSSMSADAAPPFSPFNPSSITVMENGANKWETAVGNFYDVGTLELDSDTFELLKNVLMQNLEENDSDEYNKGPNDSGDDNNQ